MGSLAAGLDDFARLDAGGACVDATRRTLDDGAYTLDIGAPTALGAHVRVRHRHAPGWTFATYFANSSHFGNLFVSATGIGPARRRSQNYQRDQTDPNRQGLKTHKFAYFPPWASGSLAFRP
jgi:hypothetical protein